MNTEQGISNNEVGAGSEPAPTKFFVRYSIFKELKSGKIISDCGVAG